jgi:hypothetical protein
MRQRRSLGWFPNSAYSLDAATTLLSPMGCPGQVGLARTGTELNVERWPEHIGTMSRDITECTNIAGHGLVLGPAATPLLPSSDPSVATRPVG